MRVLIVGIGHPDRGDDAAGPRVSERLRGRLPEDIEVTDVRSDLFTMLDRWRGKDKVVVVDAMRSGAAAGTVRRFDVVDGELGSALGSFASTHSVDLRQAIELARSLHRMPPQLIVYGIEAMQFEFGAELSACVAQAVERVADQVEEECSCTRHR